MAGIAVGNCSRCGAAASYFAPSCPNCHARNLPNPVAAIVALAAALLAAGLVDRLHLFLAPLLIGGDGRAVLGPLGVDRLARALRPARLVWHRLGPDLHGTAEW